MTVRFFQRRTIWWPTWIGWAGLFAILGIPLSIWFFQGEAFLGHTQRQPSDVLIVEGWIGIDGIKAAKSEFERGAYRYVIATGGMSGNRWDSRQWSMAGEAEELLLKLGLSRDRVILATPQDVPSHRTFASAVAVRYALRTNGIRPSHVNLFTFGAHARRSRLVYAKVLQPETKVGIISWTPPGYDSGPWWQSSERSLDLLKETVGFLFEALLNSGRLSNSSDNQPR